uniref:SCAN box domain-containing protein n=1 Tax=Laticauda laticaudata TaxID=8630 RepID=A0A8C5SVR8_LATLA
MRRDRPQERAASWPAEHIKVLLALWTEAAVTHDLSSHGRNRAVYDGISQRLAEMGIYRTGDQCREKMKGLKVAYRKAKENNSVGRPPIKCPFYDEIDQIMTQYINCRPGFPSEVGEGSSVSADRQEGLSISEPWGTQSSISERWGSQASGHWLSQTAASESQGTDEFSYTHAEAHEAFGEIQVIPVQVKEEESEDEISPELDVASPMLMEIQPPPRQLISMLDQRPHLRTRKQKVQGDGQSRGAGQKCSRSHQPELQRMQKQVALQAEEKQSLAEFIQHDREMRREDREFQAQLFEKLFQKQTELVQVLTQRSPASPSSAACANPMQTLQMSTKNGAGTATGPGSPLQALLEQIMQSDLPGKSLNRLAVKEALGGRVKVPPEVQYWTAEEILRWLLSQQPPADHCQEVLSGPRFPFVAGHLGAPGKGDNSEAPLSGLNPLCDSYQSSQQQGRDQLHHKAQQLCASNCAQSLETDVDLESRRHSFRQFQYQEAQEPQEAYQCLWRLSHQWLRPEARSKEQIMELLVVEQFLNILPEEIQTLVRECQPENGKEAVALAERFQLHFESKRQRDQVRVTSDNMVVDSPQEDLNEDQRQPCIKDSRENPRKVGLQGTETHLQLRKRDRSDPRKQIVPKQDGEHGVAAAKQMKLNNSIEEQEVAETRNKAKEMPTSVPGKQAGKAKGRGRSVPSYNVAGERQAEGEAKTKSSSRVSEAVNGILHEQKASTSLGSSQLAFDKDATVASPQPGHDGHGSPDIDRPSFSDSIDILLDSPWSVNGSGDTAQDGAPGSRMLPPCVGCTVLKAELDTVREELRLTQASTLYGLSGTPLQDLSEALGTVVRVLNNTKSLPGTNIPQNIAEIPSRPAWRERNHL